MTVDDSDAAVLCGIVRLKHVQDQRHVIKDSVCVKTETKWYKLALKRPHLAAAMRTLAGLVHISKCVNRCGNKEKMDV